MYSVTTLPPKQSLASNLLQGLNGEDIGIPHKICPIYPSILAAYRPGVTPHKHTYPWRNTLYCYPALSCAQCVAPARSLMPVCILSTELTFLGQPTLHPR